MIDDPTGPDVLRDRVLDAVLAHVAFDGWSQAAIRSAVSAGAIVAAESVLAFPAGPVGMIEWHSLRADRRVAAEMERRGADGLKVRDRITLGIRLRLEGVTAEREAVRRAIFVLAFPFNAPLAAKLLYRTVDSIWYAAGDTATDFNFYTKRGLLAGVYSATLMYWLNDRSDDGSATWAFLARRIDDVMRIEKLKSRVQGFGATWRTGPAR